jgi:hypothetical protein
MTTPLDAKLVPVALKLIEKFGTNVTFHIPANDPPTFNPATNTAATGAITDVVRKMSPPDPYTKEWIDGKLIVLGDARSFIAASGITFTPNEGQQLTYLGVKWLILKSDPLISGDEVAAYELRIRKAD